jgi:hypothetical protein
MGAPTSAILAEIYIQYMEHKQLYQILFKLQAIEYFFIIYNQKKTNIVGIGAEFTK